MGMIFEKNGYENKFSLHFKGISLHEIIIKNDSKIPCTMLCTIVQSIVYDRLKILNGHEMCSK